MKQVDGMFSVAPFSSGNPVYNFGSALDNY